MVTFNFTMTPTKKKNKIPSMSEDTTLVADERVKSREKIELLTRRFLQLEATVRRLEVERARLIACGREEKEDDDEKKFFNVRKIESFPPSKKDA
ncbi:MAG: hypothetical protein BVN35_06195 [Proteobacteria bacterium ST_bin11]|nr:MAG: hypothetical protein BVN35_06195 [Proteobacteria bacterium ST_bin11]